MSLDVGAPTRKMPVRSRSSIVPPPQAPYDLRHDAIVFPFSGGHPVAADICPLPARNSRRERNLLFPSRADFKHDSSQSPHLTIRVRTQNRSPRAVRFTLETENPNVARPKQTAAAKRKIVLRLTGYPPLVRAIVPLRRQSRPGRARRRWRGTSQPCSPGLGLSGRCRHFSTRAGSRCRPWVVAIAVVFSAVTRS